ncbi:hypothetical protein VaNZ11_004141 [Volvox africanus]|uniref:Uncharacterized protein n=1 Tax=Volvox africanus TaxID=51714 RepID=A0ABQ5RWC3_9CHLO|nr:hypothetical protein VaNZ11_004141 [Volvox africanus]
MQHGRDDTNPEPKTRSSTPFLNSVRDGAVCSLTVQHRWRVAERSSGRRTPFLQVHCEMDAAAAGHVVAAVRAQACRSAAVRRVAARLSYDVIVVLCGVRPAFLLDYAVVPPEPVLAVAQAGAEAVGTAVAVLTLDGCHLVGRVDELLQHMRGVQRQNPQQLQTQQQAERTLEQQGLRRRAEGPRQEAEVAAVADCSPELAAQGTTTADAGGSSRRGSCVFVAFRQRGGTGMQEQGHEGLPETGMPHRPHDQWGAYVLPLNEAQRLTAQLDPLRRALQALAACPATTGPITNNTTAAAAVKAYHIHLDRLPDLPMQPTLQGLLLGYPLVYDVRSHDEAAIASRCLAVQGLMLHRVVALPGGQLEAILYNRCSERSSTIADGRNTAQGHGVVRSGPKQQQQRRQQQGSNQVQLPERDLETLCGFSVPRSLAGEAQVAAAVREWHAQLTARLAVAGNRETGFVQSVAAPGSGLIGKGGKGREGSFCYGGSWFHRCEMEVEEHLTPNVVL